MGQRGGRQAATKSGDDVDESGDGVEGEAIANELWSSAKLNLLIDWNIPTIL